MKDKILVKIALASAIIGIVMLFLVSSFMKIPERQISNLSDSDISKTIKIVGKVSKVVETQKVATMTVEQPVYIDAIIFKDNADDIPYSQGDYVEVSGEYRQVKGKKEMVIDEIKMKALKKAISNNKTNINNSMK